jgi:hypothetical protein
VSDTIDALLRDLLIWLERAERPYPEVMEVWRTSCPRLTVWEDANERGLIEQTRADGRTLVRVTAAGRAFMAPRA